MTLCENEDLTSFSLVSCKFFKDGLDYVNKMNAKMRIEKGYDYNPNEKEFKNLLNTAKNIVLTKRSKG